MGERIYRVERPYVDDEALGIKLLLTTEDRAALADFAKEARATANAAATARARALDEKDVEAANRQAGIAARATQVHNGIGSELDTDDALRKQENARLHTFVFRRPTVADRQDIELDAYDAASVKAKKQNKPVDQRMVDFCAQPLRVKTLLLRVEGPNGEDIGGMEAVPDDLIAPLAQALEPVFSLSEDARRFLAKPAPSSPKAARASGKAKV